MAYDVFISYSAHDKTVADAVCASLESRRIRCWIAPRDVLPGTTYAEALIDGIHHSRILVLVFSANSNESQQVMREVERAVNKGIPIIPFRIQDVLPSKAMEYFVSSSHWLDALTPPLEKHLQKLADTVQLLLADEAEKLPKAEPGTSTPKPIINVKWWKKPKRIHVITGSVILAMILVSVLILALVDKGNNKGSVSILSNPTSTPTALSSPALTITPTPTDLSTPLSTPALMPTPTTLSTPSSNPTPTVVPTSATLSTPSSNSTLTAALIPIPAQLHVLFADDFSNPDSGWQVLSSEDVDFGYESGEYSFVTKKQNWTAWAYNTTLDQFTDFIFEIDATQISGPKTNWAGYGLLFRSPDLSNFYCFAVSPNGQYSILKARNGNWDVPPRLWTPSSLVKQGNGTNHLRIVCKGSQLDAYINGSSVASVSDTSFMQGKLGVVVGSGDTANHIHFDNLKVFAID